MCITIFTFFLNCYSNSYCGFGADYLRNAEHLGHAACKLCPTLIVSDLVKYVFPKMCSLVLA
jgi:hypothetical protein